MAIDTSGNVGIGTTSINTKLHVVSSALADSIRWTDNTNSTGLLAQIAGASTIYTNTSLAFGTGSAIFSEKMRIDSSGNVGIGTTSPNASAILDAQSTTKGVRFPNMTTTQKNAISSPAAGLVVFDTTLAKLSVYSGSAWQTITSV
jgi:hypothetical protein